MRLESYTNLFTIKCHYYGKFNDGPKKEYIEGETCFVDLVNRDQFTDVVLNTVINSLGYEMEDEVLYWYKIPLKSLDVGLKPLVSESDYRRFLGYVKKHKVMDVYVEIVEKNEESESGSDSASESDNDFEDEEHVVQEVEVNMGYFNFQVEDASTGTDGNMIPVAPKVNLTEDNIEVLEFDSLESDLEDVPENDRRDVATDLIITHAVESGGQLAFLRNDSAIRIRDKAFRGKAKAASLLEMDYVKYNNIYFIVGPISASSTALKKIIDLNSFIEAQIDGSEPGNEALQCPIFPPFVSVFEDDAYWIAIVQQLWKKRRFPLGKYIPNGKHAAARPIIKSEAFQTGVVLGVANPKTWAAIDEKLRKRPSKH
ncbi:hypothetical protein Tco_0015162 [Tanacetum coccineum]